MASVESASAIPMASPPTMAPGMLPMPPMTIAASALSSGASPICGKIRNSGPSSAPPSPPSAHAIAKLSI
jgi:hypothetical protein